MEFGDLFKYLLLTLVCFFVVAPVLMNTIGRFTVFRRFSILMVNEEVITKDVYKKVVTSQMIIGTVISLLFLAAIVKTGIDMGLEGWLCILSGLAIGVFKNRKSVQYTSFTVQQFQKVFVGLFDADKLNKFIEKNF